MRTHGSNGVEIVSFHMLLCVQDTGMCGIRMLFVVSATLYIWQRLSALLSTVRKNHRELLLRRQGLLSALQISRPSSAGAEASVMLASQRSNQCTLYTLRCESVTKAALVHLQSEEHTHSKRKKSQPKLQHSIIMHRSTGTSVCERVC